MLHAFLKEKPLYYNEIDYTRMPRVYEKIKENFKIAKIVHIIGTNGKGTTGRFLASALFAKGFKVGHYTSPHILEFNERVWLNGANVSNSSLDRAHQELQSLLTTEDAKQLSYFEYTTLLAMLLYKECDYVVLEAGLGGEYDATAIFPKLLTLVTPIDLDHEAFLGESIQEIATTKLNAMQKNLILSKQKFKEVQSIAQNIASKKDAKVYTVEEFLESEDAEKIATIAKELSLENYLQENLKLSISALKFLGVAYTPSDFKDARLFGRLSKIAKNILIDVGHNPLAATSIAEALSGRKFILIYNSYKDKDYKAILQILKPIIWHVEILDVDEPRIELVEHLQSALNELEIQFSHFKELKPENDYLVFGSFSVVETFLREQYE
ncbi:MAG: bifunctional folylpolyglutamate synthase/dihydrofolate synthase [Helicobacteraceae bacterium CG1_02_36_14]|nr:MAG: bifunctional folylpolyglutamate synthase/dihydrofolate synthase [Helicobacteraceae bacterium CG1_02_36_14]